MGRRLHLIIDSSLLGDPNDLTLYLEEKFPSDLERVTLKAVTLYNKAQNTMDSRSPASGKAIYIHCDILNKDENFFNGKRSDIIGFLPGNKLQASFGNTSKSLKSSDFTSIRLRLSEPLENLVRIIYELEFTEK